jgi:hypothetical protein
MNPIKSSVFFSLLIVSIIIACSDSSTDPPGNQAPTLTSSTSVQAVIEQLFSYTATANDPDGANPAITIDNNPGWTTVNGSTITGTPSANTPDTSFRVIASDGQLADTAFVSVEIVTGQTLVSYSDEIQPVFNGGCGPSSCHIGGNSGGLTLDSYADLMDGGNSGDVVVPGNPDNSIIVRRIEGSTTPRMPLGRQPLSNSDIQKIRDWIGQGALDN